MDQFKTIAQVLAVQSQTNPSEYILTPEEETAAINHAINQERMRKFRFLTDNGLNAREAAVRITEIGEDDIKKDDVLQFANMCKIRAIEEAETRKKEKEADLKRFEALKAKCDAKYHLELIKANFIAENGYPLICNKITNPLIRVVCFFLARDPRFETELKLDGNKGLMLQGVSGLGKTAIIYAARNGELNPIKIESMIGISEAVKDEGEYIIKIQNEKIIYLDDVGTEQAAAKHYGNSINWFKDFIEKWYLNKKPFNRLIISTNLSANQMEERYGFRVRDRMREMFNRILVEGESMRR